MDSNSVVSACINCGHPVNEVFCEKCGQRAHVKRMSFKEGWLDFWSRLYGFDGMFPRTLRDLTLRPGLVAREFIRGVRVKYYGPVGYFFLMVTLLLLLISSVGMRFADFVEDTRKSLPIQNEENIMSQWIIKFVSDNVKLVLFLGIPFQGLAARYLFFRKSGYRLIEHMVLPFYISGHLIWLTMSLVILKVTTGMSVPNYTAIVAILFYGYAYVTWATHQPKIKSFFKGIGIYLGGQLLFILFIMIIALATIIWFRFFDPETFDLLRPSNMRN